MSSEISGVQVSSRISVREIILAALPDGPNLNQVDAYIHRDEFTRHYEIAPRFPPDLFGLSTLLLERAGAYQYFLVSGNCGAGRLSGRASVVTPDRLQHWVDMGVAWREAKDLKAPKGVQKLWANLIAHGDDRVFQAKRRMGEIEIPDWWELTYALMVIADTACSGVGLTGVAPTRDTWVSQAVSINLHNAMQKGVDDDELIVDVKAQQSTIGWALNREIACVMPKLCSPAVGCSMRNLSLNVSLLPPRGALRAHWTPPLRTYGPDNIEAMNLLLIPFPYRFGPDALKLKGRTESRAEGRIPDWGRFDIEQTWLATGTPTIADFVMLLLEEASKGRTIHGIVLPEFALTCEIMEELRTRLHQRENRNTPYFVVAGTSDNCDRTPGNHAMSISRFVTEDDNDAPQQASLTFSRPKHHRWQIDRGQMASYGFGTESDRDAVWWENLLLEQREIHFAPFAYRSMYSVLICEDLARSEPCHDALRSVGPNLIFVLLMDSVQVQGRWPARYATGLAEDPGASVLTFTSRALIERSNRTRARASGDHTDCWSVALWTDDNPAIGSVEVACPPGQHGAIIRLAHKPTAEVALDGRVRQGMITWHIESFTGVVEDAQSQDFSLPVMLDADTIPDWVQNPDDVAEIIRSGL